MGQSFYITALAFHMAIIQPAFQDNIPGGTNPFGGTINDFTLMDNVATKTPIINIKKVKNILQRRDASCDLVYKKIMSTTVRSITADELYAATQECKNAFYQDALKDWRNNDPLFGQKVLPFFQEAVKADITSNAWFGDISRADVTAEWSTTKYDGVFKWLGTYFDAGIIPESQSIEMPDTDMRANPASAFAIIKGLYDKQNDIMRTFQPGELAIYCTKAISDGYEDYLLSLGNGDANTFGMYANGVKIYSYKGVPIIPEPIWDPILKELYGADSNAAIMTIRGNFVFGTDKNYGEGPELKDALRVWYSDEKLSWMYQMFLKCGTQIALPEHIVFSVSA